MFTSDIVIVEAVTLTARALGNRAAAELGRTMLASPTLTIVRRSAVEDAEGLDELERLDDQRVGFADCVSFTLMRKLRIDRAFTFDRRHFATAGFTVFP